VLNSNTAGKKKIDKAREQSYKELAERTKRVNALERAGRELDTQRNLMVYPFFFFFFKKKKRNIDGFPLFFRARDAGERSAQTRSACRFTSGQPSGKSRQ